MCANEHADDAKVRSWRRCQGPLLARVLQDGMQVWRKRIFAHTVLLVCLLLPSTHVTSCNMLDITTALPKARHSIPLLHQAPCHVSFTMGSTKHRLNKHAKPTDGTCMPLPAMWTFCGVLTGNCHRGMAAAAADHSNDGTPIHHKSSSA